MKLPLKNVDAFCAARRNSRLPRLNCCNLRCVVTLQHNHPRSATAAPTLHHSSQCLHQVTAGESAQAVAPVPARATAPPAGTAHPPTASTTMLAPIIPANTTAAGAATTLLVATGCTLTTWGRTRRLSRRRFGSRRRRILAERGARRKLCVRLHCHVRLHCQFPVPPGQLSRFIIQQNRPPRHVLREPGRRRRRSDGPRLVDLLDDGGRGRSRWWTHSSS